MATIVKGMIGKDHYTTVLQAGNHTLTGDEPLEEGGADKGPNPHEFVLLGLATCTCATLRMYADRHEMQLDKLEVELEMEVNRVGGETKTTILKQILFYGKLSEQQINTLKSISDKCPVHRLLSGEIIINHQA